MQAIASEVRGLQRAAYVLAIFAFLSSLLALLRNRIFAHIFGASLTLDLYNTAFSVLDFIFVALGALVSIYVLIPELSKRDAAEQYEYIDTVIVGFSFLAVVVCGLAAVFAPYIFTFLFPKFAEAGLVPTLTHLMRIMLLQPVFLGFSNILAAITQSRHRYILYALSPLVYNAGIIVGAIFLYPVFGITGLAWGVVGGSFLHVAIQIPSIVKDGFFQHIPRLKDVNVFFRTVMVSAPRALALSMGQLAYLGLITLAGLLATGSIAIFRYSYDLQGVSLTIIGASYSVAAFPGLAAALARGDKALFIEQMAIAARYVAFWSMPVTALFIVLRAHIVRVLLGTGAFNWTDTRLTAAAVALFSASLFFQGLTLLIVRAYYAAGRTFIPFFVACASAVLTVLIGAAAIGSLHEPFVHNVATAILRVVDVPGVSVLGLAFAYSFASIIETVLLTAHFEHKFGGFMKKVTRSWIEAFGASLAAGCVAYLVLQLMGPITLTSTILSVFIRGLAGGVAGICAAMVVYGLLNNHEFKETVSLMRTRIPGFSRRAATLSPDIVAASEEQPTL